MNWNESQRKLWNTNSRIQQALQQRYTTTMHAHSSRKGNQVRGHPESSSRTLGIDIRTKKSGLTASYQDRSVPCKNDKRRNDERPASRRSLPFQIRQSRAYGHFSELRVFLVMTRAQPGGLKVFGFSVPLIHSRQETSTGHKKKTNSTQVTICR